MVNVAILGFGTVGSGVAEVLAKNADHIDQKVETPVRLKYILDVRDFPDSPFGDKVVHDFGVIENDPTVDIGGTNMRFALGVYPDFPPPREASSDDT